MSGIAGIWNLDGAPSDHILLPGMLAAMSERGPDGTRYDCDGEVAIGHCMLATTPESVRERQPLWDETRACCLALDGRIDNREDLSSALESLGLVLRDDTDAELLLKAYIAWGRRALDRLVGDFAFAVWDRHRRLLFCARDHLGIRPFYYYCDGRVFAWASDLHPLLRHPAVSARPNEHMIGEFLGACIGNLDESLYRDIRRLPPACSLTVRPGNVRLTRYWEPSGARLRYRRESEYADHLRSVLTEAVRCRVRSHAPVAAELSGGLDSSSVVALAQPLAAATGHPLAAFSMIYPGLPCDESNFIDAVCSVTGVAVNKVVAGPRPRWFEDAIHRYRDFPGYPNGEMHTSLWREAVRTGCRVILTGLGGDEWLGGYSNTGTVRLRLATSPWLRRLLRKPDLLPWIDRRLFRRARLYRSLRACAAASRNPRALLRCGHRVLGLEVQARLAAAMGVELRHPFHDVRVVSFAASLPPDQLQRGQDNKWALRESMRGLLPELVRTRRSKAEFSHAFAHALGAGEGALLDRSRLVQLGYLADGEFSALWRDLLRAYHGGNNHGLPHIWPLWNAHALNAWMEAVSPDVRLRDCRAH